MFGKDGGKAVVAPHVLEWKGVEVQQVVGVEVGLTLHLHFDFT